MLVHTITLNTVTKYKVYPYIQTSIKSNFKYLEKWLSLTVHQPFFPGKVAPRPEIQKNISHTGAHYHPKHCDQV